MSKNIFFQTIIIILIIIILCLGFTFAADNTNSKNIDFLKSYNWEVEKTPTETVQIQIPESFDAVYLNYNELQQEAGLDLSPYRGFAAMRYTYRLKNFPEETNQEVFANVICVDNVPVAGDICTYALDGFMYSLNFNTKTCYSKSDMPDTLF